jgi:hypothetical protein
LKNLVLLIKQELMDNPKVLDALEDKWENIDEIPHYNDKSYKFIRDICNKLNIYDKPEYKTKCVGWEKVFNKKPVDEATSKEAEETNFILEMFRWDVGNLYGRSR